MGYEWRKDQTPRPYLQPVAVEPGQERHRNKPARKAAEPVPPTVPEVIGITSSTEAQTVLETAKEIIIALQRPGKIKPDLTLVLGYAGLIAADVKRANPPELPEETFVAKASAGLLAAEAFYYDRKIGLDGQHERWREFGRIAYQLFQMEPLEAEAFHISLTPDQLRATVPGPDA